MRFPCFVALLTATTASAGEIRFTQQGRLLDGDGSPLSGAHDLTVTLHDALTGGNPEWTRTFADVPFADGFFAVTLTGLDQSTVPVDLDVALAGGGALFLGLAVDGAAELQPRDPMAYVPAAARAARAEGAVIVDLSGSMVCDTVGGLGWDTDSGALHVCDGATWSPVGAAPPAGEGFRYYRLLLLSDTPPQPFEFLGGFTVWTGAGATGSNLGALAGPPAYSVYGGSGSMWDPPPTARFATLDGPADTTGGRVQCQSNPGSGNCWVTLDTGAMNSIASWGMLSRPNIAEDHWSNVRLLASNDNATWTQIDQRTGLVLGVRQVVLFDVP